MACFGNDSPIIFDYTCGMRRARQLSFVFVMGILISGTVLWFDLYFPLGVAAGVPYVALVLVGLITQQPRTVLILAAIGSALTIVGYYFSPAGGIHQVVLINRGLALFAIWSVAIVSYRHLKTLATLEPLATTDQLTHLYNRHYFSAELVKQINIWRRYHNPLSVISLDIDYFKNINDNYGHLAGDYALQVIANICVQQVRDIDTVARIGGEEFAILLPSTHVNGALQIGERIRKTVDDFNFSYEQHNFRLTISMGIIELTDYTWSVTEIMKAVDGVLYEAKKSGRNRCVARNINHNPVDK